MHLCLKLLCAKVSAPNRFFGARDFSLTVRAFWRAEPLRWVENNFEEMREVDQCSDEMKTVEKNFLTWHVRGDGMRWEELRWGEKSSHDLRWDEVRSVKCKCEVWRVQYEVWGKCSLGIALRRGRAQVMFLDNICATASHKARTHGPGWRTAHANSIDEKGLIMSYSISLRQLPPRLVRVLLVFLTLEKGKVQQHSAALLITQYYTIIILPFAKAGF